MINLDAGSSTNRPGIHNKPRIFLEIYFARHHTRRDFLQLSERFRKEPQKHRGHRTRLRNSQRKNQVASDELLAKVLLEVTIQYTLLDHFNQEGAIDHIGGIIATHITEQLNLDQIKGISQKLGLTPDKADALRKALKQYGINIPSETDEIVRMYDEITNSQSFARDPKIKS